MNWSRTSSRKQYERIPFHFDLDSFYKGRKFLICINFEVQVFQFWEKSENFSFDHPPFTTIHHPPSVITSLFFLFYIFSFSHFYFLGPFYIKFHMFIFRRKSFVKYVLLKFIKEFPLNCSRTSSRKIYKRIPFNFDMGSFYKGFPWKKNLQGNPL